MIQTELSYNPSSASLRFEHLNHSSDSSRVPSKDHPSTYDVAFKSHRESTQTGCLCIKSSDSYEGQQKALARNKKNS